MVFEVKARTWTAKPTSQRRIEADTAALRAHHDMLERQLRTDKHLLREQQEVAWRARHTAARYSNLVNSVNHPMVGAYYPVIGGGIPRTRAISQYGYSGLVTPGSMHRHPLDARMLQDIRHHRNLAALTQQERMMHQERELLRLQQMEEMRLRSGAINHYNLSPRYYDLPDVPLRTPRVAPLTPGHLHRRASFGTPYTSDLLSPYERLAALEPAPHYTPKVTPYLEPLPVTHTPYGRRLGTPHMGTIDPVLF